MAEEVVINCESGEATAQPDTFLDIKPDPAPTPEAPPNPLQIIHDALATIANTDPGYNVAQTTMQAIAPLLPT